jgi:hypothetical protein
MRTKTHSIAIEARFLPSDVDGPGIDRRTRDFARQHQADVKRSIQYCNSSLGWLH